MLKNNVPSIDENVKPLTVLEVIRKQDAYIKENARKGDAGEKGPQGEKGDTGSQGERGLTGPQGSQGPEGNQGPTGQQGLQGPQGIQGIRGEKGTSGNDFVIIGTVSNVNELPETAKSGEAYFVGVSTPRLVYTYDKTGVWVNQGAIKGETGSQGEQGVQGPQGPAGAQGVQGPAGSKGDAGEKGPQGDAGEKGPQGEKGDTGPQGERGLTGSQGVQGPQGPQGSQGPSMYSKIKTLTLNSGYTGSIIDFLGLEKRFSHKLVFKAVSSSANGNFGFSSITGSRIYNGVVSTPTSYTAIGIQTVEITVTSYSNGDFIFFVTGPSSADLIVGAISTSSVFASVNTAFTVDVYKVV